MDQVPAGAFSRPTAVREDSRIPAKSTDLTQYEPSRPLIL